MYRNCIAKSILKKKKQIVEKNTKHLTFANPFTLKGEGYIV